MKRRWRRQPLSTANHRRNCHRHRRYRDEWDARSAMKHLKHLRSTTADGREDR